MSRKMRLVIQLTLVLILVLVGFTAIANLQFDISVLDYIRFETTYYASGFLLDELMGKK